MVIDSIVKTEQENIPSTTIPPVQSENLSLIEKADNIARRMEEANKKAEELIQRQEAIAARMLLSGRAEAGSIQKTPEQIRQEEVDKFTDDIKKRFLKR